MIARTSMEANLRSLQQLFRRAPSQKAALFYSKLAILELCGWIEESMDDVILRCASRRLTTPSGALYVQKQIVNRTHGFDYDANFREMLIRLVGLINVERIEREVDQTKQAKLKATLSTLKTVRNTEAHTHLKGTTKSINAPTVTIQHFNDVYVGLKAYEEVIRNKRF